MRISPQPIRVRAEVTEPDIVLVLDPGLLRIVKVTGGLKPGGLLVVNAKSLADFPPEIKNGFEIALVDGGRIAREVLGVPIVNTTMLGALLKARGLVKLTSLEAPLKHRFGKLAEKNLAAMKRAYEETTVKEPVHG